jgi:spermidine/putrescine transport system permease protein
MSATPWKFRGLGAVTAAVFVFLYMPILVVVALSFSGGDSAMSGFQHGVSMRWYRALLTNEEIQRVLVNSLIVGSVATALSTLVAVMAALGLGQSRFPGQRKVEAAILAPLVIPEIVLGVALMLLFVAMRIRLGLATIAVAHVALTLPVAYVPIRARLQDLDPAFFEAAADLYASPWLTFRRVTLPLIAPGIAAGAMLSFIGSFSDVVVAYFLSGPGATTLPVYALSMVRVGVSPLINAVSSLLLIGPGAILTAVYLVNRSQEKLMET